MLIRATVRETDVIPHFKDGKGEFRIHHIVNQIQMQNKCAMFADGILPPQSTVGMHTHMGTMEIVCFRAGSGLVRERDAEYSVSPGDVSICYEGECHEVVNTGDTDLVYTLLVIKC